MFPIGRSARGLSRPPAECFSLTAGSRDGLGRSSPKTFARTAGTAGTELFERMTRRYGKPTFGLDEIEVDGVVYPVLEDVVWSRPFCNLLRFVRPDYPDGDKQPK